MLHSRTRFSGHARQVRHHRLRARVHGTAARPRLSVFRSAKHLSVQLIDDVRARTLLGLADGHLRAAGVTPSSGKDMSPGVARAFTLGKLLAERAREQGITTVVFDRGGYEYHGQVKAVADGAREGGLVF